MCFIIAFYIRVGIYKILDSADSKFLIPLSFLADAPAACDAASGPVQCAGSQPGAFPSAMHGINLDRW